MTEHHFIEIFTGHLQTLRSVTVAAHDPVFVCGAEVALELSQNDPVRGSGVNYVVIQL